MKMTLGKLMLFLILTSTFLQSFAILVFVKTLTGKTITIDIDHDATTNQLYQSCSDASGVPIENIRIILSGKVIPNNYQNIQNYNIALNTTMHMVIRRPAKESDDSLPDASSDASTTVSAGPMGVGLAGAGAGATVSAGPMGGGLAASATITPINIKSIEGGLIKGSYIPGVTTNHEIYVMALPLTKPGFEIARLVAVRNGNAVAFPNDDNIFEGPSSDGAVKAVLREIPALPASDAATGSAESKGEDSEEEDVKAVANAIITEALIDIETIDSNNLVFLENKLKQFGATYQGLANLDFDEKQIIFQTILSYKKQNKLENALKAIHLTLKHNQFKI